MRNRLVMLVASLAMLGGACATEETPRVAPGAATPSSSAEALAATPSPSEPEPAPAPAAEPPPVAPAPAPAAPAAAAAEPAEAAATGTVQNTHTMEEVGAAIESAIAAAAAVEANGDDLCGVSYRGLQAMLQQLARAMPDQPTNPLPPRDRFLEVCREMPAEVQQCLVVSYAMEHQAACQAASENLDPAVRARLDAMMNSGAAAPAAP